jgi:hypothetical protein
MCGESAGEHGDHGTCQAQQQQYGSQAQSVARATAAARGSGQPCHPLCHRMGGGAEGGDRDGCAGVLVRRRDRSTRVGLS